MPIFYDPMISKLVTWGESRPQALARMQRALAEYEVRGIKTTIPFFQWVLTDPDFISGRFDTGFIDRKLAERAGLPLSQATDEHFELAAVAAALTHLTKTARASMPAATPSRWKNQARSEAVRRSTI